MWLSDITRHVNLRHQIILASLVLSFNLLCRAQDSVLRQIPQEVFVPGESLKYRVFYDSWLTAWITAGYGTMTITESDSEYYGRKTWEIEVIGRSAGLFNLFYKVEDRFVSFFDPEALIPWHFVRRTLEGSYQVSDDVYFNHFNGTATSSKKTQEITPYVQDIVSAFYYVRTFDFDTAEVNDVFYQDFFLDDSLYTSRVVFLGRERLKTPLGKFNCLKFRPEVAVGEIFQEPYPMVLWVTDDRNRIPLLIKSAVIIGSVMIELVDYSGLLYPLGKK